MQTKEESKSVDLSFAKLKDGILPSFSFYQHLAYLDPSDRKIKRDYNYKIVGPLAIFNPPIPIY